MNFYTKQHISKAAALCRQNGQKKIELLGAEFGIPAAKSCIRNRAC